MASSVIVRIEVPDRLPEEAQREAEQEARRAATLVLWQAGAISTREAAQVLDLTYWAFLDLLNERGIPVVDEFDPERALAMAENWFNRSK